MKRINHWLTHHQTAIFRLTFCSIIIFVLIELFFGIRAFFLDGYSYKDMLISEWLINYEGGFVRRGLCGQVILMACQTFSLNPVSIIVAIYLLSLLGLYYLLYDSMKTCSISPFVIVFPICILTIFLGCRRDYIALIIAFYQFQLISRYFETNKLKDILVFQCLSIVNILMHEVSFFFTIPLITLFIFERLNSLSTVNRSCKSLTIVLPSIIAMALVCVFKGDSQIAESIWESWQPIFAGYPTGESLQNIGLGVKWLTYDTSYALNLHFARIWKASFVDDIPSAPFNIYMIIAVYYVITQINTIQISLYPTARHDAVRLSNILIIQFLSLIPMFGFLSCDLGRIVQYWTVSSLFAYRFLNLKGDDFPYLSACSKWIQNAISKSTILSNKLIYLFIIFTIPIARTQGCNIVSCFAFIPQGWRYSFWENVLTQLPLMP